jgi:peroxiredoxin
MSQNRYRHTDGLNGVIAIALQDALIRSHALFETLESGARYAAIAKVVAEEQEKRIRRVGDDAPAFILEDIDRGPVSSSALLQEGPLVVSFYRGLWCPYCQRDLAGFEQILDDIRHTNTSVIAITHFLQSEARQRFVETHDFHVALLDDVQGTVAEEFGIRWAPEDSELIEKELGWDIITPHGTGPWILPIQARYVIAPNNRIVFAEIAFNYNETSGPSSILPLLADLSRTSS